MQRIRWWIIAVTLVLLGGLFLPASDARAELSKDAKKRAQLATVQLLLLDPAEDVIGSCTGTMIDTAGYILTNFHCVGHTDLYGEDDSGLGLKNGDTFHPDGLLIVAPTKDARQAPVPTYVAQFLVGDPSLDIAVVKIISMLDENAKLPTKIPVVPIVLGDSDKVDDLDYVAVIGYPAVGGRKLTTTDGKISGVDDQNDDGEDDSFKTDAEISPGNSGGLAINEAGEQIGIPTAIQVANGGKIARIKMINLTKPLIEQARSLGGAAAGPPNAVNPSPSTPPPANTAGGSLGTPVFGTAIKNDTLVNQGTTFPASSTEIHAVFQYQNIKKGTDWGYVWTYKGKEIAGKATGNTWSEGSKGAASVWVEASTGKTLPTGAYGLDLYLNGKLASQGAFAIGGGGTPKPTPPPAAEGVIISGSVADANTKRPISGASVLFLKPGVTLEQWQRRNSPSSDIVASATTDRDGLYLTAPALPRHATYTIVVSAKNYRPVSGDYPVDDTDPPVYEQRVITLEKK